MAALTPHHQRQASLEYIINPVQLVPLSAAQRANARRILYQPIEAFEGADNVRGTRVIFIQPRLVRYTYEYSLPSASQDIFLRAFLECDESIDAPYAPTVTGLPFRRSSRTGKRYNGLCQYTRAPVIAPRRVPRPGPPPVCSHADIRYG
ncbi:hypothetical protein F503_04895 [Ophiostoma piceae UAMH 11346]|uniref:Uncharacterized protein n=1 Tax=Ophiostoma piceae (strain UAMH 11346) TaxID=1262450 RepID=S3BU73_OPHP1|nr:hypothetical protein F503_04895 [Ophiostoma piceae UAMH 11346]